MPEDLEHYELNQADLPERDWELEDIEEPPALPKILAELTTTIRELRQQLEDRTITPRRQWHPASSAYDLLGYDSYRQLWEAIDSGLLRVGKGKEVSDRRKPGTSKPVYYVHVQRCLDRLELSPGERKP
ncbi:hypothetical protein IFO70_10095 [Phormidium tenue FACHB-886]|nr:hypothetical protein [Phormidium tenue FACHB-886]